MCHTETRKRWQKKRNFIESRKRKNQIKSVSLLRVNADVENHFLWVLFLLIKLYLISLSVATKITYFLLISKKKNCQNKVIFIIFLGT